MSKPRERKFGSTEKLNKSNMRRSVSSSSINKVVPKDGFRIRRSGSLKENLRSVKFVSSVYY